MTTESFGAAMKRLQSLAGYTSEQLDTLKEAILSMSANERDTHFQGSSHFLLQEMSQRRFIGDDTSLHYEEMQTLIAQFAYDLVQAACIDISDEQMKQGVRLHPNAMLRAVADLTAWPEPPTTAE